MKELTDSGYVLSEEELDQGYILACQSIPKEQIVIEYDEIKTTRVEGRVISQSRLTHDITRLVVETTDPVIYKAGQYADLCLDVKPDISRSYSFATANVDAHLQTFFIRQVEGGQFSTLVNNEPLVGHNVQINGPMGEFWLRDGEGSLLFVAGGSGLAPIMAILEQAVSTGVTRPATLLFGAREEKDLYILDDISAIASLWPSEFTFIPILSDLQPDSGWQGHRGMVTDLISSLSTEDTDAYLCGPPVMVDRAEDCLIAKGCDKDRIYADRFTMPDAVSR